MQGATGMFFLRTRPGLKPALWRTGERRHSAAPVTKDHLCTFLERHEIDMPYSTAIAVLRFDFTDEFPQLADDVMELLG